MFFILVVVVFVVILNFNTRWWRETVNKNDAYYIEYSELESNGLVLNALNNYRNDNLLAGPLDGLLNIVANMPLAGNQNAYLPWSYRVPAFNKDFKYLIYENPPSFVYFTPSGNHYMLLRNELSDKYTKLIKSDGSETNLYILNSEINNRSNKSWQRVRELN